MNTHCISDRHKGTMVIYDDEKPCPLCAVYGREKYIDKIKDLLREWLEHDVPDSRAVEIVKEIEKFVKGAGE